jgi:hypothetical protein
LFLHAPNELTTMADPTNNTPAIVTTTAKDVLLYVPNMIGYSRVVCTVTSLTLMLTVPRYWVLATALYIASFVGDLFGKNDLFVEEKYMDFHKKKSFQQTDVFTHV